jgi:hypothetical protein
VLAPTGGKFASVRPATDAVKLPENVELVYDKFSMSLLQDGNEAFKKWWYEDFLPEAIAGAVDPTPVEKRSGGLSGIMDGITDLLKGVSSKKLVLNPQE